MATLDGQDINNFLNGIKDLSVERVLEFFKPLLDGNNTFIESQYTSELLEYIDPKYIQMVKDYLENRETHACMAISRLTDSIRNVTF